MAKTRSDLVTEALDLLGVLPTGQPPEVEDAAKVDGKVDTTLASIAALEIATVGDADSIPDEWFDDVAAILAGACTTKFGLGADDTSRLLQSGLGLPPGTGAAAMSLLIKARGRPTGEPIQVEYF